MAGSQGMWIAGGGWSLHAMSSFDVCWVASILCNVNDCSATGDGHTVTGMSETEPSINQVPHQIQN